LVDDLAAAVVPAAGIALRVLVRRRGADRLEHRRPREVLGCDQLDLVPLPLELAAEQVGDLRVDLRQPGGAEVLERLLRDRHRRRCYSATRPATRARASSAETAPSRRTRGVSPVRSITVDGTPGSSGTRTPRVSWLAPVSQR